VIKSFYIKVRQISGSMVLGREIGCLLTQSNLGTELTMQFEWDEDKNQKNIKKHGIPLKVGAAVFDDKYRLERHDGRESRDEDRFITIGMNEFSRILYVVYTMRDNDEITRLISVRKADRSEQGLYERNRRW